MPSTRRQSRDGPRKSKTFAAHDYAFPAYVACSAEVRERLELIVREARAEDRKASATPGEEMSPAAVQAAVARLAQRKFFSVTPPEFRARVRKLRAAIQTLHDLLPTHDGAPPWPQMRALFTGGNAFSDGPDRIGDAVSEGAWKQLRSPAVLKDTLEIYQFLLDGLLMESSGTRPPQVPESMFVEELADYWVNHLKLPIKNGRGGGGRQHGKFADFVLEARRLYPWLGERAIGGSLDGHIRAVGAAHKLRSARPR
jgi:hypothetical protein